MAPSCRPRAGAAIACALRCAALPPSHALPAPPEITADAQGGSGLPSFIIFDFTEKKNELFYNEFR